MTASTWQTQLAENVARVRTTVDEACRRAGRNPAEVHLVGVTKYVSEEVLDALVDTGVADIGESRVQQIVRRASARPPGSLDWPDDGEDGYRWHMIGHLQRNKIKPLLPHCRILHSLDSIRLVEAVEKHAGELDVGVDAFLEVNVAGEASKTGTSPAELDALASVAASCSHLRLRGLMTMAPYDPDPETTRPYFAKLRDLSESLRARGFVGPDCIHLSMGMSQDYAIAVEEGATFIRVGSTLFEGLPSIDPRG